MRSEPARLALVSGSRSAASGAAAALLYCLGAADQPHEDEEMRCHGQGDERES